MKTNLKKITVMALLSVSLFAGCKKEQGTNQNAAPVNYQVTDRMQVNNEEGKPRPLSTLPLINDEVVAFDSKALNSGHAPLKKYQRRRPIVKCGS